LARLALAAPGHVFWGRRRGAKKRIKEERMAIFCSPEGEGPCFFWFFSRLSRLIQVIYAPLAGENKVSISTIKALELIRE
jgi:hypothetical protein